MSRTLQRWGESKKREPNWKKSESGWRKPKWKKRKSYAYTEEFNNAQWAWEFLRRNPDYRKDWKSWHAPNAPVTDDQVRHLAEISGFSTVTKENVRAALADVGAKKWHLAFACNPFYPVSSGLSPWDIGTRPWEPIMLSKHESLEGFKWLLRRGPHVQAFALALDRPMDRQIDWLKRMIGEYQKKHGIDIKAVPGSHQEKWELYLRVLDARAAGATYGQIALKLYGDSQKTNKAVYAYKQAAIIRDGGYTKIATKQEGVKTR